MTSPCLPGKFWQHHLSPSVGRVSPEPVRLHFPHVSQQVPSLGLEPSLGQWLQ